MNSGIVKYCFVFFTLASTAACKHPIEVKPQRKEIVDAVFGSGHIENKDQYAIMANVEGYLKNVYIAEGDTVRSGQLLYQIEGRVQQTQVSNALANLKFAKTNVVPTSPQITQLKIQINQARDKATVDSLTYARYQRLVKTHAVSVSDMENAGVQATASAANLSVLEKNLADLEHNLSLSVDNAKAQYEIQQQNNDYYSIRAKANGVVFTLTKKAGDYLKKGDQLAEVGAGVPIIKLYIAEEDIQRIRPGQSVLVSLNSNKDSVYKAVVTKVYPAFDAVQQAFTVEASFLEQPPVLINGTQLQGNVILGEKKDALVIPSWALLNGDSVMLKHNNEKVAVKVGIRSLEWTEIMSGITENDVLVQPKNK